LSEFAKGLQAYTGPGTFRSPIIDEDGGAIGMILAPSKKRHRDEWSGHHMVLIRSLPGSFIESISDLAFPERKDWLYFSP
jgi:hypothetical protein